VGLVDLPGLQDYLDTLSPVSSQRLLKKITGILRLELRGNDVIGRWTATSFMVMLPGTPSTAAGLTFQRIQAALSEPIKLEQYDEIIQLEAVIGVASHDGNMTPQELINHVKDALEKSRRGNTGPVSFAAGNN
jgi:diguanylate cyclase (GGDEF)-like protein